MQMKSMFSGDTNKDELHCRSGPGPLISVNADFPLIIRYFLAGEDATKNAGTGAKPRQIGRTGPARRPRVALHGGANSAC